MRQRVDAEEKMDMTGIRQMEALSDRYNSQVRVAPLLC